VADVADGEEVLQAALLRLLLVALVLEVDAGHLHVDRAVRARRDGVPVGVDDEQLADRPRLPDRAGLGPPAGRAPARAAGRARRPSRRAAARAAAAPPPPPAGPACPRPRGAPGPRRAPGRAGAGRGGGVRGR